MKPFLAAVLTFTLFTGCADSGGLPGTVTGPGQTMPDLSAGAPEGGSGLATRDRACNANGASPEFLLTTLSYSYWPGQEGRVIGKTAFQPDCDPAGNLWYAIGRTGSGSHYINRWLTDTIGFDISEDESIPEDGYLLNDIIGKWWTRGGVERKTRAGKGLDVTFWPLFNSRDPQQLYDVTCRFDRLRSGWKPDSMVVEFHGHAKWAYSAGGLKVRPRNKKQVQTATCINSNTSR